MMIRGHARERICDRLQMTIEEVEALLEQNLYVLLGYEDSSSKAHKLFFSTIDSNWFVAVEDEADGHVITILPAAYHNRWKISPEALRNARVLIEGERLVERAILEESHDTRNTAYFRFSATFIDSSKVRRTIKLGTIPRVNNVSVYRVVEDKEVLVIVGEWISNVIKAGEKSVVVLARFGKKAPVAVDLRRLDG